MPLAIPPYYFLRHVSVVFPPPCRSRSSAFPGLTRCGPLAVPSPHGQSIGTHGWDSLFELPPPCNTCTEVPSTPYTHSPCTLTPYPEPRPYRILVSPAVQVGEHFMKDAFSNLVTNPLQNAAVDQVVSAAGVQVGRGGEGRGTKY